MKQIVLHRVAKQKGKDEKQCMCLRIWVYVFEINREKYLLKGPLKAILRDSNNVFHRIDQMTKVYGERRRERKKKTGQCFTSSAGCTSFIVLSVLHGHEVALQSQLDYDEKGTTAKIETDWTLVESKQSNEICCWLFSCLLLHGMLISMGFSAFMLFLLHMLLILKCSFCFFSLNSFQSMHTPFTVLSFALLPKQCTIRSVWFGWNWLFVVRVLHDFLHQFYILRQLYFIEESSFVGIILYAARFQYTTIVCCLFIAIDNLWALLLCNDSNKMRSLDVHFVLSKCSIIIMLYAIMSNSI